MNLIPTLRDSHSFAVVVGLTDGILNALTLAASHFVSGQRPAIALSIRIALGSAVCGIFVFFTAEYARLRGELLESERQLNLTASGKFATTSLGRRVRNQAIVSALFSSTANFLGAFLPLWLGAVFPGRAVLAIIPSVAALGLLGAILARSIHGRSTVWVLLLMLSGVIFATVGVWLHIA
jgi:predicted membrane protein (TIGR00267 family)